MTRSRDVADTQDNLGGAVAPFVGSKNFAINGNFDFWQRGTSFTTTGYGADRWFLAPNNGTASRQSTNPPVGAQYYLRNTMTASGAMDVFMYFETSQIIPLIGKTVTLSAKIRRNATMNASMFFRIDKSSTVDAGSGATWVTMTPTGGTSGTSIATNNVDITTGTGSTDWTTITRVYDIPNDGTANSLRVIVYQAQVVPTGSIWDLAQMQLEIGNVQTPFARAGGSIGGELALCQRYYFRNTVSNTFEVISPLGLAISTTSARIAIQAPVTMRVIPTSVDYANVGLYDYVVGVVAATSVVLDIYPSKQYPVAIVTVASGLTQYRNYFLLSNSTLGYIGFSAEL